MSTMFTFQVASDVIRDGLGVELLDESGNVVAEVFRSDALKTVTVSVFVDGLPLVWVEKLLAAARDRLGEFDDGSPLPKL